MHNKTETEREGSINYAPEASIIIHHIIYIYDIYILQTYKGRLLTMHQKCRWYTKFTIHNYITLYAQICGKEINLVNEH